MPTINNVLLPICGTSVSRKVKTFKYITYIIINSTVNLNTSNFILFIPKLHIMITLHAINIVTSIIAETDSPNGVPILNSFVNI